MTETHFGGCLCGKSRYEVSGASEFNVKCYFRDCQRVSGSGHSPQLAFRRKILRYTGPIAFYEQGSDSGNDLRFHFCSKCGTCIFKYTSKLPDLVFIPAGTSDDPRL